MDLSGKVLVVTGADGALGQAVAAILSGYGAKLALLSHAASSKAKPPAGARSMAGSTCRSRPRRIRRWTGSPKTPAASTA